MSETDRELLELAAKAANYRIYYGEYCKSYIIANYGAWNPLADDGDALRLAVNLNIDIDISDTACDAWSLDEDDGVDIHAFELVHGEQSKIQATRRAITRAAAEIGKAMNGE